MDKDTFWIVWCPTGLTVPRVRHQTQSLARVEAERMASENRGQEFFVMGALSVSRRMDVVTIDLDVIPF